MDLLKEIKDNIFNYLCPLPIFIGGIVQDLNKLFIVLLTPIQTFLETKGRSFKYAIIKDKKSGVWSSFSHWNHTAYEQDTFSSSKGRQNNPN